jgi:hypothetical protein
LDDNGAATIGIPKAGLTLDIQVGTDHLTGTIGDGGSWSADILADRAVFSSKHKAPFAGVYTAIVSGGSTNTDIPQGDGYLTITVDASGKVKVSGALADGAKVTGSFTVSKDGQWPLFISLYNGGGQILGWITFAPTALEDVGGMINWIKEPNDNAKFYPAGFNLETNLTGSVYISTNKPVTGFSNATLTVTGGNVQTQIVNEVTINPKNKVTNLSTNKLTLTISASTGVFKGSVVNPATGNPVKFNGIILQKTDTGRGFSLGTDQSAEVILDEEP